MTSENGAGRPAPDLARSLIAEAMREIGFAAPDQTAGQLFVTSAGKELRRLVSGESLTPGPFVLDAVSDAVWDALDEVNRPDDLPITESRVQGFIEALKRRGWYITLGPCRPHEWSDEGVCMSCGSDGRWSVGWMP